MVDVRTEEYSEQELLPVQEVRVAISREKRDEQRQLRETYFDANTGELVEEGEIFELSEKIKKKLGIDEETLIQVIDSESDEAAFLPAATAIYVSTAGLSREGFKKLGIEMTEDHIAALYAHEYHHKMQFLGDQTADTRGTREKGEKHTHYKFAGHDIEHEADREGMLRLARAGYNPYAMVELLEALKVLHGEHSAGSHPKLGQRINHLKEIMFDDEHPVANTETPMTPLSESVQAILDSPSSVYQERDRYLAMGRKELEDALEQARDLNDYFTIRQQLEHVRRVEKGRALAETDVIDDALRKAMAVRAYENMLEASVIFTKFKASREQAFDTYHVQIEDSPDKDIAHFVLPKDYGDSQVLGITTSQKFRDRVPPQIEEGDLAYAETVTKNAEAAFDKDSQNIPPHFRALLAPLTVQERSQIEGLEWRDLYANRKLTPTQVELLQRDAFRYIMDVFEGKKPVDAEFLGMVYPERDRKLAELRDFHYEGVLSAERIAKRNERLIDWEKDGDEMIRALRENCATTVFYKREVTTQSDINVFQRIVEKQFNLNAEAAEKIARHMLTCGEKGDYKLLEGLTTDELFVYLEIAKQVSLFESGRLSPKRELHQEFTSSLRTSFPQSVFEKGENEEKNNRIPLEIVWSDITRVILQNEYTGRAPLIGYGAIIHHEGAVRLIGIKEISEFNLSIEQWKELAKVNQDADEIYRAKALREYLDLRATQAPIPRVVIEAFLEAEAEFQLIAIDEEVKDLPLYSRFSPEDIRILLIDAPWGREMTDKVVAKILKREVESLQYETYFRKHGDYKEQDAEKRRQMAEKLNKLGILFAELNANVSQHEDHPRWLMQTMQITRLYAQGLADIVLGNDSDAPHSIERTAAVINTLVAYGFVQSMSQLINIDGYSGLFKTEKLPVFVMLTSASPKELEEMARMIQKSPGTNYDLPIAVGVYLLALELPGAGFSERAIAINALQSGQIPPTMAIKVAEVFGESIIRDFAETVPPSTILNRLIAMAIDALPDQQRAKVEDEWVRWLAEKNINVDLVHEPPYNRVAFARGTAIMHPRLSGAKTPLGRDVLIATTEEEFDDLFARRHAFQHLSFRTRTMTHIVIDRYGEKTLSHPGNTHYEITIGAEKYNWDINMLGNVSQGILARRLAVHMDTFVDSQISFEERLLLMVQACPIPTIVRDIHLERMIRTELKSQTNDISERIARIDRLLEMFGSTELIGQYAGATIELWLLRDPQILRNPEAAVDFIEKFYPKPTLARNYFLKLVEESAEITPKMAKRIDDLRVNEELKGKKGEGENSIAIINHMVDGASQKKKRESLLWLIQIYKDKPASVLDAEASLNGMLDAAREGFVGMTPLERAQVIKKFLVGGNGILEIPYQRPNQVADAEKERQIFLEFVSKEFIPDSMDNYELFRDIFVTVLEKSDPVRASLIISNLINKVIESRKQGVELPPWEILSTALCDLGVVGKKVAQSLAEMKIPEGFQVALSKAQETADPISKRAIIELAEQEGLIDGERGIKIIAFGEKIGAASNKQAILLRCEVTSQEVADRLGVNVGDEVTLVGKFKRPSAQKAENLTHDLNLLRSVVEVIDRHGYAGQLPPNFVDQVEVAIRRELQFEQEIKFNEKIKENLSEKRTFGKYTLDVPTIAIATGDVVLETVAPGVSMRSILDDETISPDVKRDIKAAILSEVALQMLVTGDIHADLHPGNIFVDLATNRITIIDLGMNTEVAPQEVKAIRTLVAGLAIGNKRIVQNALNNLGWEINAEQIPIERPSITNGLRRLVPFLAKQADAESSISRTLVRNINLLLNETRNTETPLPDSIGLTLFALSKIEAYIDSISQRNLLRILGRIMT